MTIFKLQICPSDDPLDHPDFNEVDYINKLFPNEQSLTSIDDIINNVKSRISNVDEEIRKSLHEQNASAKVVYLVYLLKL
jgi:hypothetical protein